MKYRDVELIADQKGLKILANARQSFRLAGWVYSPDVGIAINRKPPCTRLDVKESRRKIHVFPRGGDCTITGKQPPNSEIHVWGGARSLTINADANVSIGGPAPIKDFGLALSMDAAMRLEVGNLEILLGAGARSENLSLG